ncbi:hypothetical protein [Clostridium sp. CF012]|nr:hypothetical protein [Clostridium sp. CF012]
MKLIKSFLAGIKRLMILGFISFFIIIGGISYCDFNKIYVAPS